MEIKELLPLKVYPFTLRVDPIFKGFQKLWKKCRHTHIQCNRTSQMFWIGHDTMA